MSQFDQEYIVAPEGSNYPADFRTDGIDDQVQINEAINVAASNKGVVRLAAGTYNINPSVGIVLKDSVALIGAGIGTIIRLPNSTNTTGNIVKAEGRTDVLVSDFVIDGNRAGQSSGDNYGLYLAACVNPRVMRVKTINCRGVGNHLYNCTAGVIRDCHSENNLYHGFECEQNIGTVYQGNRGTNNDRHGISIAPGEQSGTGSKGCSVIGNTFDANDEYGINADAANDGLSPYLSAGILIEGNNVRNNAIRGITIYRNDNFIITGNFINGNQQIGLYLYQAQNCIIKGNIFMNNSQAANNAHDEILLEGYNDNNAHPSKNNLIEGNTFIFSVANKARYAVNEATSNDGPNYVLSNVVPVASATTPSVRTQHTDSTLTPTPGTVGIDPTGTHELPAGGAGFDNAFANVLRVVNLMGGETQYVNNAAAQKFYLNGLMALGVELNGDINMFVRSATHNPPDNNTMAFWLDEAGNALKFRVKYSGGTIKEGTLLLV